MKLNWSKSEGQIYALERDHFVTGVEDREGVGEDHMNR